MTDEQPLASSEQARITGSLNRLILRITEFVPDRRLLVFRDWMRRSGIILSLDLQKGPDARGDAYRLRLRRRILMIDSHVIWRGIRL